MDVRRGAFGDLPAKRVVADKRHTVAERLAVQPVALRVIAVPVRVDDVANGHIGAAADLDDDGVDRLARDRRI